MFIFKFLYIYHLILFSKVIICTLLNISVKNHEKILVNTKRRAGRAGGPCCQMKNMNYPRGGELHRSAGWQAAARTGPWVAH